MIRIVVAAEEGLSEYRNDLVHLLEGNPGVQVLDANALTSWDDNQDLIDTCVRAVIEERSVDFAVLLSLSGSGLSMLANKHPRVVAAVLPSVDYVEEAVELNANMCEISSVMSPPSVAAQLVLAFAEARRPR